MNKELEFLEEKHGDNSWGYYPPSKREVAQWMQEWTEKQFAIQRVSNSIEHKERIEAYKECFETYIPTDKWDEATLFLSTYGSGLAKDLARKER